MAFGTVGINQGTQTGVPVDTITGTNYPVMKLDIGAAGLSAPFTGTFLGGTIDKGTIAQVGTVNSGTFQQNMVPVVVGTSYGTVGTTGGAVWGTLVSASGAGIKQYVSGVDVVVVSGTVEVAVTNIGIGGSTGNGVLTRGNFPAGGGISKIFNPVQASGTNGTLAFWMGGAGTVDVTIQYWQGA